MRRTAQTSDAWLPGRVGFPSNRVEFLGLKVAALGCIIAGSRRDSSAVQQNMLEIRRRCQKGFQARLARYYFRSILKMRFNSAQMISLNDIQPVRYLTRTEF